MKYTYPSDTTLKQTKKNEKLILVAHFECTRYCNYLMQQKQPRKGTYDYVRSIQTLHKLKLHCYGRC